MRRAVSTLSGDPDRVSSVNRGGGSPSADGSPPTRTPSSARPWLTIRSSVSSGSSGMNVLRSSAPASSPSSSFPRANAAMKARPSGSFSNTTGTGPAASGLVAISTLRNSTPSSG